MAMPVLNVFHFSSYRLGAKLAKKEKDSSSIVNRIDRMKQNYAKDGMRTSVEGILVVHKNNTPHILLLQVGENMYKLPGGRLRRGENEIEGLQRKLSSNLGSKDHQLNWQIGECVGCWWRPQFDSPLYPYCPPAPPYMTTPKECKKFFAVHLPERANFEVPSNLRLLAVPLFELYDRNMQTYGPMLCSIPLQLSRFNFQFISGPTSS